MVTGSGGGVKREPEASGVQLRAAHGIAPPVAGV